MTKLAIRAEIIKLARLYDMDDSRLTFLEDIPAGDIQVLREATQDKLFADDLVLFRRLAEASKLLPQRVVAMLAEKIFGPLLGARVAGEMDTKRAVALSGKLPIPFLADVSLQLDPGRARDIIRNIPPARIRAVTEQLLERGEFVTMGRFVGYLTERALREALKAFDDRPDELLQVGFFIEDKAQLNSVIRLLSDAHLREIINAAQSEQHNLWPEAVALMDDVDDELKRTLGDLTAEQDEQVLTGLCRTAHEQQLWDSVLPVVACMSEPSRQRLLRIPLLTERDVMAAILQSAEDNTLWADVLPLVRAMSENQRVTTADIAARMAPRTLTNILEAADTTAAWDSILYLAHNMDETQLANLAEAVSALPDEAIDRAMRVADEQQLWPALLDLAVLVPEAQRARFDDAISTQASKHPERIEQLAPLLRERGLDDLLAAAQAGHSG